MSALGKVLTVFVFLGSLVWLGLTVALFSTRADWKKAALTAEKDAQDNYNKSEALTKQVMEERRQTDARMAAMELSLQAMKGERDTYKKGYDDALKTAARTMDKSEQVQPVLDQYQGTNDTLQKTVNTLTAENRKITQDRDAAVIAQQAAENRANDTMLKLKVTEGALDTQIQKTREIAEASKGGGGAPDAEFRGDVLQVDAKSGIIVFSGGANAGVKKGARYVVSRAAEPYFVGTVYVLDAGDPNISSGVFTPATGHGLKGEYIPKKGDTVSAK